MIIKEFGNKEKPAIVLLHGGGLSSWSYRKIVDDLIQDYFVITPVIDGHGEDGQTLFTSIEDSAARLIQYIDEAFEGHVYAIGGLSLGAQIAVEVISRRKEITRYAVIESALVYPIQWMASLAAPSHNLCYGLVKKRWFSKIQAKSLLLPNDLFELYYADSCKMSKQSLINITLSNGNYSLKPEIKNSEANVLILVGEKELGVMKKSARLLNESIPMSKLVIAKGMRHGEISLEHPEQYLRLVRSFLSGS